MYSKFGAKCPPLKTPNGTPSPRNNREQYQNLEGTASLALNLTASFGKLNLPANDKSPYSLGSSGVYSSGGGRHSGVRSSLSAEGSGVPLEATASRLLLALSNGSKKPSLGSSGSSASSGQFAATFNNTYALKDTNNSNGGTLKDAMTSAGAVGGSAILGMSPSSTQWNSPHPPAQATPPRGANPRAAMHTPSPQERRGSYQSDDIAVEEIGDDGKLYVNQAALKHQDQTKSTVLVAKKDRFALISCIELIRSTKQSIQALHEMGCFSDEEISAAKAAEDLVNEMKGKASNALNVFEEQFYPASKEEEEMLEEFFVEMIIETDIPDGNTVLVRSFLQKVKLNYTRLCNDRGLIATAVADGSRSYVSAMLEEIDKIEVDTVEVISCAFFQQECRIPMTLILFQHHLGEQEEKATSPKDTSPKERRPSSVHTSLGGSYDKAATKPKQIRRRRNSDVLHLQEEIDALSEIWDEFFFDICSKQRAIPKEDRTGRIDLIDIMLRVSKGIFDISFNAEHDVDKQTIFSRAAHEGDHELIRYLLLKNDVTEAMTNINRVQSDGTTALIQAVSSNDVETVRTLLEDAKGALEVNKETIVGNATTYAKKREKDPKIIALLEQYGGKADPSMLEDSSGHLTAPPINNRRRGTVAALDLPSKPAPSGTKGKARVGIGFNKAKNGASSGSGAKLPKANGAQSSKSPSKPSTSQSARGPRPSHNLEAFSFGSEPTEPTPPATSRLPAIGERPGTREAKNHIRRNTVKIEMMPCNKQHGGDKETEKESHGTKRRGSKKDK